MSAAVSGGCPPAQSTARQWASNTPPTTSGRRRSMSLRATTTQQGWSGHTAA